MTAEQLIQKFEQYVDDTTEMSSQEELDLVNKIYRKILSSRTWRFLYKAGTGTISGTTMPLPSDFSYFPNTTTPNALEYGNSKFVFVGPTYQPYKLINIEDRLQYNNTNGFAYIDIANNNLVFTKAPNNTDVYFTYIYKPDDLTINDSPVFNSDYHSSIFHGMCVDDMICQIFDKARSYAAENQAKMNDIVFDLEVYDNQFQV